MFTTLLQVVAESAGKGADPSLLAELKPAMILSTIIYSFIGMVVFGLAFAIFNKLMPFSVRKEIEEDQNTSLGIIIGAFLIGLAMIISASMH